MRADRDAVLHGFVHGLLHHRPVTGMEAAGDIGGGDHRQHGSVVAHGPGAEAFTEIAVQVNAQFRAHRPSPLTASTMPLIRFTDYREPRSGRTTGSATGGGRWEEGGGG